MFNIGAVYFSGAHFGEGTGPILMYLYYCYSARNSLFDCYSAPEYIPNISHENDAGVRCERKYSFCHYGPELPYYFFIVPCQNGDIRLVGSTDPLVGRVELCVNKTWGTICDDYWDNDDAKVVCRQVGFPGEGLQVSKLQSHCLTGAQARIGSYTEKLKSFHIIDLNCNGTEDNVFDCPHNLVQQYSCAYYEDAYVRCSGMTLVFYVKFSLL